MPRSGTTSGETASGGPKPGRAEQKRATHARILASAAGLIRAHGLEGASVADVMAGAGLTVGGFYAHFKDKSALLAEGLRTALADGHARLTRGLSAPPGPARVRAVVRRYLTAEHRDDPAAGCPLPSTLSEVPRHDPAVRAVLARAVEGWVESLTGARQGPHRAAALRAFALSVGALTLARALGPTPLSDEVLRAAREGEPA